MNRLKGQRVYLAGAVDRVSDRGSTWRNYLTPILKQLNITVLDPLQKPGSIGLEDTETHKIKQQLKLNKKYDELSTLMKTIRSLDLRMVDISDFLIVYLDIDTHPCGTLEEIFWANRQKKPILIHIKQGKQHCPDWLFGTIPHKMFFDSWNELIEYLHQINNISDNDMQQLKRWWFINEN